MRFYLEAEEYRILPTAVEAKRRAANIFATYLEEGAPHQLNTSRYCVPCLWGGICGAMSLTVLRVCMCWFIFCSETRAQVKAALDAGDADRRAFAAFARTVYSQLEIEQLPAFRQSPQFQRVMSETVQHCRSVRILFLRWLHPYLTLDAYGLCDMYGVLQPAPPDVLEGDERWRNLTLAFPGRTKTNMGINPRFPVPYHSS